MSRLLLAVGRLYDEGLLRLSRCYRLSDVRHKYFFAFLD